MVTFDKIRPVKVSMDGGEGGGSVRGILYLVLSKRITIKLNIRLPRARRFSGWNEAEEVQR